jgi:hypothetical protein
MVVALYGLAKSGKSTIADYLVKEYGYQRIKFADPLKDMLRAIGLSYAEIEGDRKEDSCKLLGGKSPRWAMQSLGTEWGRTLISPTLWVDIWEARATASLAKSTPVVVDDCRFQNELDVVRRIGGKSLHIIRPGNTPVNNHISEQVELEADAVVLNGRSVGDLISSTVDTLQSL